MVIPILIRLTHAFGLTLENIKGANRGEFNVRGRGDLEETSIRNRSHGGRAEGEEIGKINL